MSMPNLNGYISEYKEQVETLDKDEWSEWVRCIYDALESGNDSMVRSLIWLPFVEQVYDALKDC